MNTIILNAYTPAHRAPSPSEARRDVDWSKLSNVNLKFAHDLLDLHQSPYLFEVLNEICKRTERGEWLDIEKPPPPLHELPQIFSIWPFRLLHKQSAAEVGE